MFKKTTAIRAFLSLALAGLALSGCSGGSTPEASSNSDVKLTWRESPLAEYWADANKELGKFDRVQLANEAELFTASCMAEAGFDYTPIDYSDPKYGLNNKSFDENPVDNTDDREWVVQNGYGWNPFSETAAGGAEDLWADDPNALYESTLSETGQMEYRKALLGEESNVNLDGADLGNSEYKWEDAGCQGAAGHEMESKIGRVDSDLFADIRSSMEALYYLPPGSPAYAALDAEWANCMADNGFIDFKNSAEASEFALGLYDELLVSNATEAGGPSGEAVAMVLKKESELAVADFDCKKMVDYDNASQEILFALQEQFIKDNQVELDAYQAWVLDSM